MNANEQAQKGFKTFILTLSISLLLFSAIYYLVNANSRSSGKQEEVSGVETASNEEPEEQSSLYSYDESEYIDEEPETENQDSNVVVQEGPEEKLSKPTTEEDFSVSDGDTEEEVGSQKDGTQPDSTTSQSAFGSLLQQDMQIEGTTVASESAVALAKDKEDKVLGVSDSSDDSKESTAEPELLDKDLAEKTAEPIKEDTSDIEEPQENSVFAAATEDDADKTKPASNIGGVEETKPTPQVLAGATETTQSTSSVPTTGTTELTIGLIISLSVFLAAMVWVFNDPRRMALEGFERRVTKDRKR